ncbi:uncharacterized protein LOC117565558 [Drosophila albomicans]|uniref:Uncharacterized protein LOC117565558 n=1 Tax=Drosophila albomicans TaxID=7291 RepID=A0A6P8XRK6_DROAB|nr:uncharacterized protein LOC117565558 [Drosophila albomicans]
MEAMKLLLSKCNKIVSLLRCATKKKVIVVGGPTTTTTAAAAAGCVGSCNLLMLLLQAVCILTMWLSHAPQLCLAAPSTAATNETETAWPPMHHYDIWSADLKSPAATVPQQQLDMDADVNVDVDLIEEEELLQHAHGYSNSYGSRPQMSSQQWSSPQFSNRSSSQSHSSSNSIRRPKVIHLFPVPVDGECLADDGRRMGNCFNAYECRQKGGQARGECAMGFGVCCVFMAECNGTIANNLTYIVSPGFPSFMPSNFTECKLRVKIMSEDISQLRIDFDHFSLGQPNRRTGVCDGDVFHITGGARGAFQLCGQNSGQHMYYDVAVRTVPRQSTLYGSLRPAAATNVTANPQDQVIEITLNVSRRFLPMRLWEIRVLQIPFTQRAPPGCLQYHTGVEGVMQTFNFAENGRHLANQHYRICVRQETDMCSISYQPCDEQSFRIGGGLGGGSFMSNAASSTMAPPLTELSAAAENATSTTTNLLQLLSQWVRNTTTEAPTTTTAATTAAPMRNASSTTATSAMTTAAPVRSTTAAAAVAADDDYPGWVDEPEEEEAEEEEEQPAAPANDDAEGSGGGDDNSNSIFNFFGGGGGATSAQPGVSRRPRPVGGATASLGVSSSGGFDLFGFLRSAFDLRHRRRRRQARQFFSTCADRITMPCIIEDFIGTGLGPLPGCEPVHCGSQFCSTGTWPCRIESTVTPFYIGVHFGGGDAPGKGSAEENIGACLRYAQVQCI